MGGMGGVGVGVGVTHPAFTGTQCMGYEDAPIGGQNIGKKHREAPGSQ